MAETEAEAEVTSDAEKKCENSEEDEQKAIASNLSFIEKFLKTVKSRNDHLPSETIKKLKSFKNEWCGLFPDNDDDKGDTDNEAEKRRQEMKKVNNEKKNNKEDAVNRNTGAIPKKHKQECKIYSSSLSSEKCESTRKLSSENNSETSSEKENENFFEDNKLKQKRLARKKTLNSSRKEHRN